MKSDTPIFLYFHEESHLIFLVNLFQNKTYITFKILDSQTIENLQFPFASST